MSVTYEWLYDKVGLIFYWRSISNSNPQGFAYGYLWPDKLVVSAYGRVNYIKDFGLDSLGGNLDDIQDQRKYWEPFVKPGDWIRYNHKIRQIL